MGVVFLVDIFLRPSFKERSWTWREKVFIDVTQLRGVIAVQGSLRQI